MYPIIEIAGRQFGTYGIFSLVGLIVSTWVATKLGQREQIAFEDMILTVLVILGGLFLGGHLLYGLTNIRIIADLLQQWNHLPARELLYQLFHCFEGMVYYGGFLGGFGALVFYRKHSAMRDKEILDLFAVCTPLFHAFARIGCFFGGCCYGIPCRFGVLIATNPINPAINGVRRFPVQLAESAVCILIFLFLLGRFRRRKSHGVLIRLYLLLYAPSRFLLEFFRGDEIRGIICGLSTSQWISIVLFFFGMFSLLCGGNPMEKSTLRTGITGKK